jgi:hypothetical protein
MQVTKQHFACQTCSTETILTNPTCPTCAREQKSKVKEVKFFDFVSVRDVKKSSNRTIEANPYYVCRLQIGTFTINSVTYKSDSRSVMLPKCVIDGHKTRPFKAFGKTMKHIRSLIEAAIAEEFGEDVLEEAAQEELAA